MHSGVVPHALWCSPMHYCGVAPNALCVAPSGESEEISRHTQLLSSYQAPLKPTHDQTKGKHMKGNKNRNLSHPNVIKCQASSSGKGLYNQTDLLDKGTKTLVKIIAINGRKS